VVGEIQLPALLQEPGLIGAQLWRADLRATSRAVEDRTLRPEPDQIAEWVIFVEGTRIEHIQATAEHLSEETLTSHGAHLPLSSIHMTSWKRGVAVRPWNSLLAGNGPPGISVVTERLTSNSG
jgi:hypothetical protein